MLEVEFQKEVLQTKNENGKDVSHLEYSIYKMLKEKRRIPTQRMQ